MKTQFFLAFTLLIFTLHSVRSAGDPCQPEQIHIALSDAFAPGSTSSNFIKVIFHTQEECNSAYITLTSPQGETQKISATSVKFFTENYPSGLYTTYVHIFDFQNLEFSSTYEYSCFGTDDAFLPNPVGPFKFYVPSPHFEGKETKVVMFADMDTSAEGMPTVNALTEIAQSEFGKISAFVHNGDMAYNLLGSAGRKGDRYMNAVQKFTATMPYMVTAGNHEVFGNFSNFNTRFQMPMWEKSQNHYHSYNVGNMHFVSFNLDFVIESPKMTKAMLDWLEEDLKQAALKRDEQPWIIAYTHRPFYCSFGNDPDCNTNGKKFKEFEDLLIKYNVDLVMGGHVHYYERMLPIKRGAIANFQRQKDDKKFNYIINPKSPVHILQGMAGHNGDKANPKDAYKGRSWTVKVSKDYSYMSVRSENSTHLLVENYASAKGVVNDYFYVVKSNELQYAKLPLYKK